MRVFKFGGASIQDTIGFRRVGQIILKEKNSLDSPLCIVVSALGKTTNALEKLVRAYFFRTDDPQIHLNSIKSFHIGLINELFIHPNSILEEIENAFLEIEWVIEEEPHTSFDFIYDQIVSVGEIVSSKIASSYLSEIGCKNTWMDSRNFIQTDNHYRSAGLDWSLSKSLIQKKLIPLLKNTTVVCAGFIGGTSENYTTTLGREGSDYSGAIIASCLEADSLTVWKDVPGVMNADPKINPQALFIPALSYHELAELSYYGASVIHPKTIKPLLEKQIPLYVKSFLEPSNSGTSITKNSSKDFIPCYILKKNQLLLSLISKDGGFILEEHLIRIYSLLSEKGVSINLAVNTALSFSILIDQDRYQEQIKDIISDLDLFWQVKFNQDLCLLTVRHSQTGVLDMEIYLKDQEILIEVNTRNTLQKVIRPVHRKPLI